MMMNQNKAAYFIIAFLSLTTYESFGQQKRVITTACPFLTISPDARSAALGDAGVAISADANSTYWNPAKLVFAKEDYGFALSYTPWLRALIGDMSISHLSGYSKLKNKNQVLGGYLTYFNLGGINFTDTGGNPIIDFRPREFAIAVVGSQKLSDNISLSVTLRYIHSNLAGSNSFTTIGVTTKPGNSATADVAMYYKSDFKISDQNFNLALGFNLSNVGSKISYSNRGNREFLPTNLKLGTAVTYHADAFNKFTLALDFNKLLVPTPSDTGKFSPQKPYLSGVLGSFSDAPGGFKEELQEVNVNSGIEYWYNDIFAVRVGYKYSSPVKDNQRYISVGFGFHYNNLGLDAAYLIPNQKQNALGETLRFTLHLKFTKAKPLVLPEERPEEVVN